MDAAVYVERGLYNMTSVACIALRKYFNVWFSLNQYFLHSVLPPFMKQVAPIIPIDLISLFYISVINDVSLLIGWRLILLLPQCSSLWVQYSIFDVTYMNDLDFLTGSWTQKRYFFTCLTFEKFIFSVYTW